MELQGRPDADKVLQRWEAWWRCEIIDRPVATIAVARDREAREVPPKKYASRQEKWFDAPHILDCFEADLEGRTYAADSLPIWFPNLGPEVIAEIYGCDMEYDDWTSWSNPAVQSCREILDIAPDLDNEYWQAVRDGTDLSLQRGEGKWITGITDIHSNGDLLAALRDPQELCLEYYDDYEGVKLAAEYVKEAFGIAFDDLWKRIEPTGQPSVSWLACPHTGGTSCVLQADFICMLSPKMFEETILPSLTWEADYLDRSIYHLDGPDALRHLDPVLSVPSLDAVQWVAGTGNGDARDWIEVYQRCQAAGKAIHIHCADINDAKAVAEHIRPEGAWFHVAGTHDLDEVNAFLAWLDRWSAGRRA